MKALALLALSCAVLEAPTALAAKSPVLKTGLYHGALSFHGIPDAGMFGMGTTMVAQGAVTLRVSRVNADNYAVRLQISLSGGLTHIELAPAFQNCTISVPNTLSSRGSDTLRRSFFVGNNLYASAAAVRFSVPFSVDLRGGFHYECGANVSGEGEYGCSAYGTLVINPNNVAASKLTNGSHPNVQGYGTTTIGFHRNR